MDLRAFKITSLVLFMFWLCCACDSVSKKNDSLETKAYLSQFQKSALQIEIVENSSRKEIVLVFNQPMVDFDECGQMFTDLDAVSTSPSTPTTFVWLDPRLLQVRFLDEGAIQTQIVIHAGWQSLMGTALLRSIEKTISFKNISQTNQNQSALLRSSDDRNSFQHNFDFDTIPFILPQTLALKSALPKAVRAGEKIKFDFLFSNLSEHAFYGEVQIDSEGLEGSKTFVLQLASSQEKQLNIDFSVQDSLINFQSEQNFKDVPLSMTLSQGEQKYFIQKTIRVYSAQEWEKQNVLGFLVGVKKQKILSQSFLKYKSGQVILNLNLDAYDLIRSLVEKLQGSSSESVAVKPLRLAPYLLFPKSLFAFGKDEAVWQNKMDEVQKYVEEIQSAQRFQMSTAYSLDELLSLADFVHLAQNYGFVIDDLQENLGQTLLKELDETPVFAEKIKIMGALANLGDDQTFLYTEFYNRWDELLPESQMRLAYMILRMNPLHPVAQKVKRGVDKMLIEPQKVSTAYWAQAFLILISQNDQDSLCYEVFAEMFLSLNSNPKPQDIFSALTAFQKYQEHFLRLQNDHKSPVDVVVSINQKDVFSTQLNWRKRSDSLKLPIEKLPKETQISAQIQSGQFAFYRLMIEGVRNESSLSQDDHGLQLVQTCEDEQGQIQRQMKIGNVYTCRVRWLARQEHEDAEITIPRITGSTVSLVSGSSDVVMSLEDTELRLKLAQIQKGYHEFVYQIQPHFVVEAESTPSLKAHSVLDPLWGGSYRLRSISVEPH